MKSIVLAIAVSSLVLISTVGCSRVRTYTVEKDRVDQDLSSGNAGYMTGTPKEDETGTERKMTRTTYVAEIELDSAAKTKKRTRIGVPAVAAAPQEEKQETSFQGTMQTTVPEPEAKASVSSYTVENNDTLQKISLKVYGTTKKWKEIYEANKDKLKSPDRIYAGQVLRIP